MIVIMLVNDEEHSILTNMRIEVFLQKGYSGEHFKNVSIDIYHRIISMEVAEKKNNEPYCPLFFHKKQTFSTKIVSIKEVLKTIKIWNQSDSSGCKYHQMALRPQNWKWDKVR